jgi:hypothetical protein
MGLEERKFFLKICITETDFIILWTLPNLLKMSTFRKNVLFQSLSFFLQKRGFQVLEKRYKTLLQNILKTQNGDLFTIISKIICYTHVSSTPNLKEITVAYDRRSRVRIPILSLEFFIEICLYVCMYVCV